MEVNISGWGTVEPKVPCGYEAFQPDHLAYPVRMFRIRMAGV